MSSNKDEMYVRWDNSWINLSNGDRIKGIEKPITPPVSKFKKLEEYISKKATEEGSPFINITDQSQYPKLVDMTPTNRFYNITYKKITLYWKEANELSSQLVEKPDSFMLFTDNGNYDKDPQLNDAAYKGFFKEGIEIRSYNDNGTRNYSSGTYQELHSIFDGRFPVPIFIDTLFFFPNTDHILRYYEDPDRMGFINNLSNCLIIIKDKSKLTQTELSKINLNDGSLILDTKSEEYKTFEDDFIKWMEDNKGASKPIKDFIDRYTKKSSGKVSPVTNYELEEFLHSKAGSESFVETSDTNRISSIMYNESSTTDRFCLINYKKVQDMEGLNNSVIPSIINKPIAFVLFNKGLTDHSKDIKYLFASNLTFYNGASQVPSLEVDSYSFGTYQELDYIYQAGSAWGIYKNAIIFCPNAKDVVEPSNYQELEFKHCIIVINDKSKVDLTKFKLSEGSIVIDTKSPAYNKLVTEFKTWMTSDSVEEEPNEVRDFINSVLPKLN